MDNNTLMQTPGMLKAKVDGQIISQTLDNLNDYGSKKSKKGSAQGDMSSMYEFNKDVLSAAYSDKSAIVNQKG